MVRESVRESVVGNQHQFAVWYGNQHQFAVWYGNQHQFAVWYGKQHQFAVWYGNTGIRPLTNYNIVVVVVVVDRFYIALFSRSRADSLRSHVILHE